MKAEASPQFIDDPTHLAFLEGQRYVVLRPKGEVVASFQRAKWAVLDLLEGEPYSSPSFPHVTLIGFPTGSDLDRIISVIRSWAGKVAPLRVETEKLGVFPLRQTIVAEVVKIPELTDALAFIRHRAADSGFPDWPAQRPSVEQWTFHMSLAYCATVAKEKWEEVVSALETAKLEPASCVVSEVEVVAYDGHQEALTVVPLGAS